MLKMIRDFIYDINDVFVAIVILLIAVGVIFWRSTSIMAYPQYLAEKNGNTNTANLDFSDIDLTPEKVDDINPNPDDPKIDEQTQPGSETQPGDDTPQAATQSPKTSRILSRRGLQARTARLLQRSEYRQVPGGRLSQVIWLRQVLSRTMRGVPS